MFGIGAYGEGLIQVDLGMPFWIALPGGALLAMLLGTTMALPALRLSGIYLAMATLGFAQFTQWVFLNWESVTYGAGGFRVPRIDFSPLAIRSEYGVYYLSWIITLGLILFAWNAMRSRIGRAFVAMRDGEVAAESLGINLLRYKAMAFALSGIYAGTAGALYTAVLNYVAPEGFDLFQMVIHKAMVMVGGIGSIAGSVVGATLLVVLLEALRAFKSTQEIAFGAILLTFVVFFPGGLVSLFRRYVPGWDEPLHVRSSEAPRGSGGFELSASAHQDRPATKLAVCDVSLSFGGLQVLSDVNMSAGAGEIVGIIGPNGAGKTTLLNVICGIHGPDTGKIVLDDQVISGLKPSAIAARGARRTFQSSQLFRGMTVLENMMAGLHLGARTGLFAAVFRTPSMRREEAVAIERAYEALRYVGMEQFAERYGNELSFGQQRIIEIARTLIDNPRVILLDEPAVGLSAPRVAELNNCCTNPNGERRSADHDRARNPLGHGRFRPRGGTQLRPRHRRGSAKRGAPEQESNRGLPWTRYRSWKSAISASGMIGLRCCVT